VAAQLTAENGLTRPYSHSENSVMTGAVLKRESTNVADGAADAKKAPKGAFL
jgi:hypothetical protein